MGDQQSIKTTCGMCPWACGIIAHVTDGKVSKIEGDPDHPWNQGRLCPKAAGIVDHVYSPKRIKYPMKKTHGTWERISWEEALDTMASRLNHIKENYGAKSWVMLSGMQLVTQGLLSMQLLQRFCDAFGSPNFFTPESMCFLSRITAFMLTYGNLPYPDHENSRCIVLWGSNPTESNFLEARRLLAAKKRGARLIVIDPRRITLAKHADIHAQIRPGTDCALALAMLNVIISEELYDKAFVEKWTTGFDQLRDHVKDFTPAKAAKITGVPEDVIQNIAHDFAAIRPSCIIHGVNALDQHATGFQNNRAIGILQALTGNVDCPGGFISANMGGLFAPQIPNYVPLRMPELLKDSMIGQAEFPLFVRDWTAQGMLLPDMILTGKPYPIKGMTVVASNPLLTWPNYHKMKKALESVEFLVVMSITMNETAELADMVLPAASFLERTEIWEVLSLSFAKPFLNLRNKVTNFHESCPDAEFWLKLGRHMGYEEHFPWKNFEEVMAHAFEPTGLDIRKYFGKTNCIPYGKVAYKAYETEGFKTASGKIELYSGIMKELGLAPLPVFVEPPESPVGSPELAKDYPLILTTGSRDLQYTHSSFREIPKFKKRFPEPYAEIHPGTAVNCQVSDGERIIVETRRGAIEIKARVTEDILPNVISIPHGWAQSNVNILTDEKSCDPVTGYAALKALLCRVKPKTVKTE